MYDDDAVYYKAEGGIIAVLEAIINDYLRRLVCCSNVVSSYEVRKHR